MNNNYPFISVVIPIRNEEKFIARCVGAVLNQDYPPEKVEILIGDGMSDDRTVEIIQSLPGSERVRVIPNPRKIQSAGLNVTIPLAKGDYIIRVDGHTIISPTYISQCVKLLQETGAQNVGGPMDPIGLTLTGKAIAAAGKSAFAVPTAFHVSEKPQYTDTVYLGAWPREVFDQVGLFSEEMVANQDYEFNYRIRKAGGKIYFSPTIRSEYYGRQTLKALYRQYFRYGRYKVLTLRKHPGSLKPRHLVAPLFVAGVIAGLPFVLLLPFLLPFWLAGILLYIVANLFFSMRVASRAGWSLLPYLPFVFLTIHFAWGLGFWTGVLRGVSNLILLMST